MAGAAKKGSGGSRKPVSLRARLLSAERLIRAYQEYPDLDGIEVAHHEAIPAGSTVTLGIELEKNRGLRIGGEVAWCRYDEPIRKFQVAVRFVDMRPEHRKWLADQVAKAPIPVGQRTSKPPVDDDYSFCIKPNALELDDGSDALGLGGPILGIDLGTSNSCACIVNEGRPIVLELEDTEGGPGTGSRAIPSVVAYEDGGAIKVGFAAAKRLVDDPRNTIYGAKRFVGRAYDSLPVQRMIPRFPYRVVPGRGGRVAVEVASDPISLVNISGRILKAVRDAAQTRLGQPLNRAVITVPAYYNDNQRDAVVRAGRLSGLGVERILNEPTAAAIAYGVVKTPSSRVLVYDLGGGTFDVSIMAADKGNLKVLSTAGDTFLGGDDIDAAIVNYVRERFKKEQKASISMGFRTVAMMKAAAERSKRRLSLHEQTMFTVRDVDTVGGGHARVELTLTREEIDNLTAPFVVRTLKLCDLALREGRLKKENLTDILLVGGQTRMPLVRQMVANHFSKEPRSDINPDEAVALGAGIFGGLPKNLAERFQDVLPMTIGVAVNGSFKPLLTRNTSLPCTKTISFKVPSRLFGSYTLDIWQGDDPQLHRNERLGGLPVKGLQPGNSDPVSLQAAFSVSPDCLLRITLTNLDTGETQHTLLNTRDEID